MGRRALVADDEDAIVFLLTSLLKLEGFEEVLGAPDGDEARRIVDARGAELDFACIDVHMPGKSGLDVVKAAREKRPELPIVVLGGHTDDGPKAIAAGATAFLAKPFPTARFRELVRSLLSQKK